MPDTNLFPLSPVGTREAFGLTPLYRDGTKVLVCKWHTLFPKLEDVCSAASRVDLPYQLRKPSLRGAFCPLASSPDSTC